MTNPVQQQNQPGDDMDFLEVSKDKLKEFITGYPTKLVTDVAAMGEPPILTWNDFNKGDWPNSVVAKIVLWEISYPNKDGSIRPNTYHIRSEKITRDHDQPE